MIWASEHYRLVIQKLDEEERYRRLVVDELNHRLKNKLTVVHAVLRHELRSHEDISTRVLDRMRALLPPTHLLTRPDGDVVDIREILSAELAHYSAFVYGSGAVEGLHAGAAEAPSSLRRRSEGLQNPPRTVSS